jgi:hypothetical protein
VGFEPTCRLPDKTLSRRPRYDHFGTSPLMGPGESPEPFIIAPASGRAARPASAGGRPDGRHLGFVRAGVGDSPGRCGVDARMGFYGLKPTDNLTNAVRRSCDHRSSVVWADDREMSPQMSPYPAYSALNCAVCMLYSRITRRPQCSASRHAPAQRSFLELFELAEVIGHPHMVGAPSSSNR